LRVEVEAKMSEPILDPTRELPDNTPIEDVRFPKRIRNVLAAASLKTVGEGLGRYSHACRRSGVAEDRVEVITAENGDSSWAARELTASGASLSEIATELARAEAAANPQPLNKVTWAQIGRVTDPGRYMFKFGRVTITAEHIAIWKKYPNAAFTLYTTVSATQSEERTGEEFCLGTFELRKDWNMPQNDK
jgi:hypothetical protein